MAKTDEHVDQNEQQYKAEGDRTMDDREALFARRLRDGARETAGFKETDDGSDCKSWDFKVGRPSLQGTWRLELRIDGEPSPETAEHIANVVADAIRGRDWRIDSVRRAMQAVALMSDQPGANLADLAAAAASVQAQLDPVLEDPERAAALGKIMRAAIPSW